MVAEELIEVSTELIAAADSEAINSPVNPAGNWLTIKKGKTRSPLIPWGNKWGFNW